jgi:hypothetical protein
MRILVCGGRDMLDKKLVYNTLYDLCEEFGLKGDPDKYGNWMPKDMTIIHGKAAGADTLADDWAVVNWTGIDEYPADWETHGRSAGFIRNKKMLEEGRPDLVVAFPTKRSKGTWHMVKIAKEANVPVRIVNAS